MEEDSGAIHEASLHRDTWVSDEQIRYGKNAWDA